MVDRRSLKTVTMVLVFILCMSMIATLFTENTYAASKPGKIKKSTIKVTNVKATSAVIKYGKSKGAKKYQVAYKAPGGKWIYKTTSKHKVTLSNLLSDTKYNVRIRGIKSSKKKGKWSSVVSFNTRKTVYYASSLSDFTKRAVKNTGYVRTGDKDTTPDIFAVSGSGLASLSDEEAILSLRTCLAGKALVLDRPDFSEIDAFWKRITEILDSDPEKYEYLKAEAALSTYTLNELVSDYNKNVEYTASVDEHDFDAIGMVRGQIYFVNDIDRIVDANSEYIYTQRVNSDSEPIEYIFNPETGEYENPAKEYSIVNKANVFEENKTSIPAEDMNGIEGRRIKAENSADEWEEVTANTADCFTKWLKENKADESGLEEAREAFVALNDSAGQETLDSLLKAQTCTFSYTVEFNMDMDYYNGSLNGKKEVVEVVIDVWNVCEIENKKEYWLVRSSTTCNNQQLGYTQALDQEGIQIDAGPYFDSMGSSVSLEKGKIRVEDCSPKNAIGSTTFTTGSSFNIGGSLGFAANGPSAGLTGNYTVTHQTSQSIPDISVVFTPGADGVSSQASWGYSAPQFNPGCISPGEWLNESPKPIQTEAATFDTYALYERDSRDDPDKNSAILTTNTTVNLAIWRGSFFETCYAHNATSGRWVRHHIPFNRPSNLSGEYIMAFTPPKDTSIADREILSNALKNYFSNWGSNVKYYAFGDYNNKFAALDPVAKNSFAGVKQTINKNMNVLKDQGFSGTYEFYIQNVSTGKKVDSFSMTF